MIRSAFLRRLSSTTWGERLILAEATALLGLSSLAIRLLPFRTLAAALGSFDGRGDPGPMGTGRIVAQARWAVAAAAPYLPWKIVCFQRGLALHVMLRRRGVPSLLHYGVAQTREKGLSAHVWVSQSGEIIIGGEEAPGFACLATFPPAPHGR